MLADNISTNQVTQRDLEFALNERETAELGAFAPALKRLEAGTYGECVDCGEPVAKARLLATPEVTRCIAYQKQIRTSISLRNKATTTFLRRCLHRLPRSPSHVVRP